MKKCELCNDPARMYCESDQASLCWDCDEKVHCANFLVAKHSRCLLCHVCQSPTPWKASGPKLGHTVSVCEFCVSNTSNKKRDIGRDEEIHGRNSNNNDDFDNNEDDYGDETDGGDYSDSSSDDDGDGDEDGDEDDEEDGENQVVPWSTATTPPPPVASSSSSSEEEECTSRFGGGGVSTLKRRRENVDLDSDEDIGCSSSQFNHDALSRALTSRPSGDDEATSFNSLRPMKEERTSEPIYSARIEDHAEGESKSMAIIGSLKRFQDSIINGSDVSATILGIRNLSRDPRAVDLDCTASAIPNATV